jgi:hypothetical protein
VFDTGAARRVPGAIWKSFSKKKPRSPQENPGAAINIFAISAIRRQENLAGNLDVYYSETPVDFVISCDMRTTTERTILTVARHEGNWSVEQDGVHFGQSADKEVAKAAASRRARTLQDDGQACQIRVSGEHGFWMKPA